MTRLSFCIFGFAAIAVFAGAADQPTSFPIEIAKDNFAPNVLDASGFIEAPTGKHGFVP